MRLEWGLTCFSYSLFQPVVTSQLGTINNLIHVKKSDFEVFDALKLDSMESSETSCRGNVAVFAISWCAFLIMHVPSQEWFLFPYFFIFSSGIFWSSHIHVYTSYIWVCIYSVERYSSSVNIYVPFSEAEETSRPLATANLLCVSMNFACLGHFK